MHVRTYVTYVLRRDVQLGDLLVGGVVTMDDQLSDPNAREENHAWSPSDGRAFARKCIAEARAGIETGRKRFAERQRELDERRARHDQETP